MNVCVLAGVEGADEEAPQVEGEDVFFGDKTKTLRYAIVQDVVVFAGQGLEAGEQIIDQLVHRDFDATVSRLEG